MAHLVWRWRRKVLKVFPAVVLNLITVRPRPTAVTPASTVMSRIHTHACVRQKIPSTAGERNNPRLVPRHAWYLYHLYDPSDRHRVWRGPTCARACVLFKNGPFPPAGIACQRLLSSCLAYGLLMAISNGFFFFFFFMTILSDNIT